MSSATADAEQPFRSLTEQPGSKIGKKYSDGVVIAGGVEPQIAEALAAARSGLAAASDVDALRRVANEHAGKGSVLVGLKSSLGSIADVEARKATGRAINEAMQSLEALVAERLVALERAAASLRVALPPRHALCGCTGGHACAGLRCAEGGGGGTSGSYGRAHALSPSAVVGR